ncbi:MAG: diaminopimelate epimerase [Nocardioides sp.]
MNYPFAKGHGTENDFVLLPDPDGSVHGGLDAGRVRALCDRRSGIGGDGVLRVLRADRLEGGPECGGPDRGGPEREASAVSTAAWFMDYRNADGSVSEMCGNGIRVFARYLVEEGLAPVGEDFMVGTRDGDKTVRVDGEFITVDMGRPEIGGESVLGLRGRSWPARQIATGNPHAVVFVDSVAELGELGDLSELTYDADVYPEGVNVEFVARLADRQVAMRVLERGVGETRSCGTGACAVMVAAALADGAGPGTTYGVQVPGGSLAVEWTARDGADTLLLTGPAILVAAGTTRL